MPDVTLNLISVILQEGIYVKKTIIKLLLTPVVLLIVSISQKNKMIKSDVFFHKSYRYLCLNSKFKYIR